jgi:PIN domain nuclease of toxin-antitoxin system
VTIKQSMGKLAGPADLPERIRDSGFRELPISVEHAMAAGRLPLIHGDPIDRMLVAQARCAELNAAAMAIAADAPGLDLGDLRAELS